jgi:hypothetical protein
MGEPVFDEIADSRPETSGGSALDRIRRVRHNIARQRSEHGVGRRVEGGVSQSERLEDELAN